MDIVIRQAREEDIPDIVAILCDAVSWTAIAGHAQWSTNEVSWESLSKVFEVGDFYLGFIANVPQSCMALVDYDPVFWPQEEKGNSLFLHKLAVKVAARKTGLALAMLDFFKAEGQRRGVARIQLETNALRSGLRSFYEKQGFVLLEERNVKNEFRNQMAAYYYWDCDSTSTMAAR